MKINIRIWNFIAVIPGLYFPLYLHFRSSPIFYDSYIMPILSLAIFTLIFIVGKNVEQKDELSAQIVGKVNSQCFKILLVALVIIIYAVSLISLVTLSYAVAITIPSILLLRAILFLIYDLGGIYK